MNKARLDARIGTKRLVPKILIADDDPCALGAIAEQCTKMGFEVETATNGLQALIKASRFDPDILVIDVHMPEVDGLSVCAFLQDVARQLPCVIVVTGRVGDEIVERCAALDASCIRKGRNFWNEFEARLIEKYPLRAEAIKRAGRRAGDTELRERPRVLLVDDDIGVKKMFFHTFGKLGAELLYASDATQGYWKARRELPTVIVADYRMPNGNADYLLSRLRSSPQTKGIPVIVQTGRRLNDKIKQRLRQPVYGQPGADRILRRSTPTTLRFRKRSGW
jgi:CheY-like chemotaxis protein